MLFNNNGRENAEWEQLAECDKRISDAIVENDYDRFIKAVISRRQCLAGQFDKESLGLLDEEAMEQWNAAH